jgi:ComF family protein
MNQVAVPQTGVNSYLQLLGRAVAVQFASLLAPPQCVSCLSSMTKPSVFCLACALTLRPLQPRESLGEIAAFGHYGGALAVAIQRLKYQRFPELARPLATLLVRALGRCSPTPALLVPVPLHPLRLAQRGFNQAALLARVVADKTGHAIAFDALRRARHGKPQARTLAHQRWKNVAGAFLASPVPRLQGSHVILVDDVSTTGATLDACRHALRRAGASRVTGLVLAIAEAPRSRRSGNRAAP